MAEATTTTAIIVDDESRGRASLKKLCEKYCKGVNIVGLADSVQMAKKLIDRENPELVFLDIRMPTGDGFSLLEAFDEVDFDVIFTTAYDQYAIKAFKFSAIDYLLKPINIQELQQAVERVQRKKESGTQKESNVTALKENLNTGTFSKVALPTTEGFTFVKREQIIRCEASGNYTTFFLKSGTKYIITRTLKYYEEMLSEYGFFRVHKSHLINLIYVEKFLRGKQGYVEMCDGKNIEVSSRKREDLLKRLLNP